MVMVRSRYVLLSKMDMTLQRVPTLRSSKEGGGSGPTALKMRKCGWVLMHTTFITKSTERKMQK